MGFRFRRSVRIIPGVRLNFSSRGISTTVGGRGFSVNASSRGTYINAGIPGTGLSSRTRISGGSRSRRASTYTSSSNSPLSEGGKIFSEADLWAKKQSGYSLYVILIIIGVIFLFFQPLIAAVILLVAVVLIIRWLSTGAGKSTSQISMARASWEKMNYDKTIEYLERAYSLYPNPHLVNDIIFQAQIHGYYDTALKYLNELDDNDLDSAFSRAECNYAVRNYSEAAKYFEKITGRGVTELQKDNIYSKLGISLFNTDEYKPAIEALQKVSSNYDNQSLLVLLIGQSFSNMGEDETAIFTLTDYIGRKRNLDENMIEMCYTLGNIHLGLGDKKKAKHWLNKVYTHNLNYKNTLTLLQGM